MSVDDYVCVILERDSLNIVYHKAISNIKLATCFSGDIRGLNHHLIVYTENNFNYKILHR